MLKQLRIGFCLVLGKNATGKTAGALQDAGVDRARLPNATYYWVGTTGRFSNG